MDKPLNTTPAIPLDHLPFLVPTEESSFWSIRPSTRLLMLSDDDDEFDDEFDDEDEDEFEDDDWADEDLDEDLEEDDEFDDEDFDDDEFDDDDFDDDEGDDYEYEYRGDAGWDDEDDLDDDEFNMLGARFASLLDEPDSGPRRFRDREGIPKGDRRIKKSHRRKVTHRRQDEIEHDDD